MHRVASTAAGVTCRRRVALEARRHASFVGAMCQGKIDATELFPFPTSALPSHVKESMVEARSQLSANESGDSWGLMVPDHFGGLGFPHPCVFDVVSHTAPGQYPSLHHHVLASFLIRSFANKEHCGRYLSAMSDGSARVGWAVDELDSPNDVSGEASAVFLEDRASFEVTAKKVVCGVENPTAFVLLCRVKRGEKNALGWLYVERDAPGIKFENGMLSADKAIVPMDNLFVNAGDGYRSAMTSTLTGHYLTAACLVQTARAASAKATAAHATRITAAAYAVESVASALAANIERGVSDTFMECALLSVLSNDLIAVLRREAATSPSTAVERLVAGSFPLAKAAACCGVEDFAQMFNASSTLETMQVRTVRMMGFIDRLPSLVVDADLVQRLEKLIVKFGEHVERVAVRQGLMAAEKDIELERVAAAGALLFSTAAVFSRAHRAMSAKLPTGATEHAIAGLWAELALGNVDRLLSVTGATSADSAHARLAADLLAE